MNMTTTPRIYVACLASYTSGRLHGAWIDVDNAEQVRAEIAAMIAASPTAFAEEWQIHDCEGLWDLDPLRVSIEDLCEFCTVADEFGEAFSCWFTYDTEYNAQAGDFKNRFQNEYLGTYKDAAEYGMEYVDNGCLEIPEHIMHYIDYEALGRDLLIDCIHQQGNDGMHVWQ